MTYELLFGKVPFDITTERDFIKIVEDEIRFSKATPISNEAKDFILICLKKDPRDRYTVAELLEHPFIANVEPVPMGEMFWETNSSRFWSWDLFMIFYDFILFWGLQNIKSKEKQKNLEFLVLDKI